MSEHNDKWQKRLREITQDIDYKNPGKGQALKEWKGSVGATKVADAEPSDVVHIGLEGVREALKNNLKPVPLRKVTIENVGLEDGKE